MYLNINVSMSMNISIAYLGEQVCVRAYLCIILSHLISSHLILPYPTSFHLIWSYHLISYHLIFIFVFVLSYLTLPFNLSYFPQKMPEALDHVGRGLGARCAGTPPSVPATFGHGPCCCSSSTCMGLSSIWGYLSRRGYTYSSEWRRS